MGKASGRTPAPPGNPPISAEVIPSGARKTHFGKHCLHNFRKHFLSDYFPSLLWRQGTFPSLWALLSVLACLANCSCPESSREEQQSTPWDERVASVPGQLTAWGAPQRSAGLSHWAVCSLSRRLPAKPALPPPPASRTLLPSTPPGVFVLWTLRTQITLPKLVQPRGVICLTSS